jgi:hypothetical protein
VWCHPDLFRTFCATIGEFSGTHFVRLSYDCRFEGGIVLHLLHLPCSTEVASVSFFTWRLARRPEMTFWATSKCSNCHSNECAQSRKPRDGFNFEAQLAIHLSKCLKVNSPNSLCFACICFTQFFHSLMKMFPFLIERVVLWKILTFPLNRCLL